MISINIYEIIFQCLNFGILFWLLKRFLTKPLSEFIRNRTDSIKDNISTAESSRIESERILQEQKEFLKKAHQEAKDIRSRTEESTKKERASILNKSKDDAKLIVENAKKEIERDVQKAKQSLTEEIATLSIRLTEKILKSSIDKNAQKPIIQEYLDRIKN